MSSPSFHTLLAVDGEALAAEAAAGLLAPAAHAHPKFFYDELGSKLFDAITALDEYDLMRTEAEAFALHGPAIAAALRALLPARPTLIDLGAGNCLKGERLMLLADAGRYMALDISVDFLRNSLARIARHHPERELVGVGLDFAQQLSLPPELAAPRSLLFYPGSSIGNFAPDAALRLLTQARQLSQGGALLIGVDLIKPVAEMQAAYDDALGVTAAFNLNLLRRLNALLGSDFDPRQWQHRASWNESAQCIEMHLQAKQDLLVRWPGHERAFAAGGRIHTECAHKWTVGGFSALLHDAGWQQVQAWTDARQRFALLLASS